MSSREEYVLSNIIHMDYFQVMKKSNIKKSILLTSTYVYPLV